MCRWRQLFIILACGLALCGGCKPLKKAFKKPPPKSDDIPPTTQVVQQSAIPAPREEKPVKSGTLPLVYLLEYPGDLRVIDATSGTVLIGTKAGGRTILSITEEKGVSIGGRTIRGGPLDPTHQYDIYLSNPNAGESIRRSTYERL